MEEDKIELVEVPTYADVLRENVNMVLTLLEEATQKEKKGVSISANCTNNDVITMKNEISKIYPHIIVKQITFSGMGIVFKRQLFFLFEEPAQPLAAAAEEGATEEAGGETLAISTSDQKEEAAGQPTVDHQ